MSLTFLLTCFATVFVLASARQFNIRNNRGQTVWIGSLGNAGKPTPENGGFELPAGQQRSVSVPDDWAGRFWARTGCNFDAAGNGHCATGDCGDKLQCNGAGGAPPASLGEVTLSGSGGQDFYDVSFVDGFNVPIEMRPTGQSGDGYRCTTAGCSKDLNPGCPGDLQVRDGNNIIACKSACNAFNTDRDCCRGEYNNPDTCKSSESARYFKSNCPGAYSYAYDDGTSTYTCENTDYEIIIG